MNKFRLILRELILDPGFGFAVSCTLIFVPTSLLGLAACIAASTAIAVIKALRVAQPLFLQRDTLFARLIKDDRIPLQLIGAALLIVTAATLVQNTASLLAVSNDIQEFVVQGWYSTLLPAIASTAYAVADFRFAAAISENLNPSRQQDSHPPQTILRLIIYRPETYVAIASISTGLMTGGISLIGLPFAFSGYTIILRNILQKRPPYTGHPNLYFAVMMALLSGIAFSSDNILLGLANLLSAIYLTRIAVLMTPGGFYRILHDIKSVKLNNMKI